MFSLRSSKASVASTSAFRAGRFSAARRAFRSAFFAFFSALAARWRLSSAVIHCSTKRLGSL